MGVAAMVQKPFHLPDSPHHHHHQQQLLQTEPIDENTTTSRKLPPSIRVISAEAEKESQKVRSLYEFGHGLQLGDGDMSWPLGGTLEPPPEIPEGPSDVDDNDAYGFLDYPTILVIDRADQRQP
jgi:hypothetical protein